MDEVPKVVPFKPQENGEVLKRRERPHTECQHYSFELNEQQRSAYCEQCGACLDPFWVLWRLMGIYKDQDYKYDQIVAFEKEQKEKAERQKLLYQRRKQRADRLFRPPNKHA